MSMLKRCWLVGSSLVPMCCCTRTCTRHTSLPKTLRQSGPDGGEWTAGKNNRVRKNLFLFRKVDGSGRGHAGQTAEKRLVRRVGRTAGSGRARSNNRVRKNMLLFRKVGDGGWGQTGATAGEARTR